MILRSSVRHVFAAAALMVTFQASARPSQESLSVLTDSFAEAALVGMKLSFAKSFDQGKVTRAQYQCVEQLNASDMRKTVYEVLAQALNDDELQDAQEFFGSSVGIKYARYGILKIYSQRGATPPEPEPLFTSTDRSELASFASRPAGKKLIVDHVLESDSARQAFTAGTVQLLRGCMAMR